VEEEKKPPKVKKPPKIEVEPIPELKAIKFTTLPRLPEVTEDHCLNPHLRLSWIAKRTWEIMSEAHKARKVVPWKVGIRQAWAELETVCLQRFGARIR